jgi:hypothetical protein
MLTAAVLTVLRVRNKKGRLNKFRQGYPRCVVCSHERSSADGTVLTFPSTGSIDEDSTNSTPSSATTLPPKAIFATFGILSTTAVLSLV